MAAAATAAATAERSDNRVTAIANSVDDRRRRRPAFRGRLRRAACSSDSPTDDDCQMHDALVSRGGRAGGELRRGAARPVRGRELRPAGVVAQDVPVDGQPQDRRAVRRRRHARDGAVRGRAARPASRTWPRRSKDCRRQGPRRSTSASSGRGGATRARAGPRVASRRANSSCARSGARRSPTSRARSPTRSRASAISARRTVNPPQPLAAAVDALATPPRPGWEGFLRPDAYLMIVVIAAGDDPSAQPAIDVARLIKSVKADPSQVVVSAIVARSCTAGDPVRLTEFVNQFGANGLLLDLCAGQFAPALQRITESINSSLAASVRQVRARHRPRHAGPAAGLHLRRPSPRPRRHLDDGHRCRAATSPRRPAGVCRPPEQGATDTSSTSSVATDWCAEAGTNITIECLACANANDPACAVRALSGPTARKFPPGRSSRFYSLLADSQRLQERLRSATSLT